MPLASDVTTGPGPNKKLLDELRALAAAASSGRGSGPRDLGAGSGSAALEEILAGPRTPALYGMDAVRAESAEPPTALSEMLGTAGTGTVSGMERLATEQGLSLTPAEKTQEVRTGLSFDEDDKRDVLTELAAEAKAKGIRGRGVQAYVQERTGMPGSTGYMQDAVDARAATDVERDMVKSEERAQRRGMNQGRGRGTDALTADEYNAMTPEQKAAVDFNTMLVGAVQADRKEKAPALPSPEYLASATELFGDGAADQPFAPNVVELLDKVNFDVDGQKINDFLKLKVALTADDVAKLRPEDPAVGPDASLLTPEYTRSRTQESIVDALRETRTDPARGATLKDLQRETLGTTKAFDFGSDDANMFMERAYLMLATPENKGTRDQILDTVRQTATPEHWKMFVAMLDTRSREARQYQDPLGDDPSVDYYKPKRFRAALGLND